MKKLIMSLMAVSSLAATGVATVQAASDINVQPEVSTFAAKQNVIKSYNFDKNTITGADMNFSNYQRINIPLKSKYQTFRNQRIGGGWNYIRYRHTNFYSGGY